MNLEQPADAGTDFGAHGSFDGRAPFGQLPGRPNYHVRG